MLPTYNDTSYVGIAQQVAASFYLIHDAHCMSHCPNIFEIKQVCYVNQDNIPHPTVRSINNPPTATKCADILIKYVSHSHLKKIYFIDAGSLTPLVSVKTMSS